MAKYHDRKAQNSKGVTAIRTTAQNWKLAKTICNGLYKLPGMLISHIEPLNSVFISI